MTPVSEMWRKYCHNSVACNEFKEVATNRILATRRVLANALDTAPGTNAIGQATFGALS
jgi:hypothetical protein